MTAGHSLLPARPVAAQAHALHAVAMLIEHAGVSGLPVSLHEDRITIQVPRGMAGLAARTAAVALLAAATAGRASAGDRWVTADGELAGHPVRIFTPAGQEDQP